VPGAPHGIRLRRLPLPVLLGLMLVGGLCALLALNTASAAQELKQRSLTESNAGLSDQAQQLMRDLAAKQAPDSLAAAAAAQGLVPNPNPAFLRLNADGSVTVLGSPAPASLAPPPATRKPTATARPGATPSTPTASSAASSAARSTASSAAARSTASTPTRPGTSTPAGSSSARPSAPVVTVTVTRPAPAATPSTTRPSPTKSTTSGGH
jgi:type II secretory pathway pseudopilin PulG